MHCLVTGATGYVGARLVPRLLAEGHDVRCLTRDAARLADAPWAGRVEITEGDLTDPAAAAAALRGIDVAYYLVHSLGQHRFAARDRQAAQRFAAAARDAGIRRIVYLGGPVPGRGDTASSPHLRSRAEVAQILLTSGVPTVVLRAAVVIGSGSVSFEMLRQLTERLPVMLAPVWVRNRVQPVAVADVLHYLAACATLPPEVNRGFDIGGPEALSYAAMMRRYARLAGLRRRIIVPVRTLSPWLSSHWVGLVTPVPAALAKPLVLSLVHEAVVHEHDIARYVPDPPGGLTGFDEAVRRARVVGAPGTGAPATGVREPDPARPLPSDPPWAGGTVYRDDRDVAAAPAGGPAAVAAALLHRGVRGLTSRLPGEFTVEVQPVSGAPGRFRRRLEFRPHGLGGIAAWFALRPVLAVAGRVVPWDVSSGTDPSPAAPAVDATVPTVTRPGRP